MYINWHIMPRALSRKTQLSLFQHGVLYILFQNSTCAHIPKNTYVQSRHTLAEHMHTYVRTHIDICIENNLHAQLVFAQTAVGSVRTPDWLDLERHTLFQDIISTTRPKQPENSQETVKTLFSTMSSQEMVKTLFSTMSFSLSRGSANLFWSVCICSRAHHTQSHGLSPLALHSTSADVKWCNQHVYHQSLWVGAARNAIGDYVQPGNREKFCLITNQRVLFYVRFTQVYMSPCHLAGRNAGSNQSTRFTQDYRFQCHLGWHTLLWSSVNLARKQAGRHSWCHYTSKQKRAISDDRV